MKPSIAMFQQLAYWEDQVWVGMAMSDQVDTRVLREAKYRAEIWGRRLMQLRKALLLGSAEADPGLPGDVVLLITARKREYNEEKEVVILSSPKRSKAYEPLQCD